ncbi:hypothetical protein PACTADRAFT_34785 [Pachysolen tannophilus NRRL Y-2460]|uniref:EKC/KEOPS complex subunit BUD32 n=1 Tax=Pachysolen tannophilus NRRL Y-2460 TaxID=669874 RepID=A0A1E4TTH7_PACTA|nr:hypothetical protein PACTADRAFT_34785 [Pachysolen tannophilus NRRL Y-2460]
MSSEIIAEGEKHLKNIPLEVISQGAEALIFRTSVHPYLPDGISPALFKNSSSYIIKYRPKKKYRHPILDVQITKSRTISEAKFLQRLFQLNIRAPKLISVDAANGIIWMEDIAEKLPNENPSSLKNWLWFLEQKSEQDGSGCSTDLVVEQLMINVGKSVGEIHLNDIVHGDLTSSNILLVADDDGVWNPTLIDFGLSSVSALVEDKAVDLYVLERALLSTHPVYSKLYNEWLLKGYEEIYKEGNKAKKCKEVFRRLEDVRLRGRKRNLFIYMTMENKNYDFILKAEQDLYPIIVRRLLISKRHLNKTYSKDKLNLLELDNWKNYKLPELLYERYKINKGKLWLEKDELVKLVDWKLAKGKFRPTLKKLVFSNDSQLIIKITKEAFDIQFCEEICQDNYEQFLKKALEKLCELRGIGPATASLILSLTNEIEMKNSIVPPFFSDESFLWFNGKTDSKIKYNLKEYFGLFLKPMEKIAADLNIKDLNIIEKGIWSLKMYDIFYKNGELETLETLDTSDTDDIRKMSFTIEDWMLSYSKPTSEIPEIKENTDSNKRRKIK